MISRSGGVASGLSLAALSAGAASAAFPPMGLWPLIWIAWVPMLIAQHRILPRRWSSLAIGVGIGGYYAVYLHPILDASFEWWVPWLPVAVGIAAALGSVADRTAQEATRYRRFVISFPLAWTPYGRIVASAVTPNGSRAHCPGHCLSR